MIKIIHIMPQIGTGGAQRQLYDLIVHSDSTRVQHQVFYYSDSNDDEMLKAYQTKNIVLTRVPRMLSCPIKFLHNFAKKIREQNPDIVQCWLVSANFWGRIAAIMAGQRHIILSWRSSHVWNSFGMKVLGWFTSKKVHHVANSRACANLVAKAIGVSPDRFEVIYNGIDISLYDVPAQRNAILKSIHIPESFKIVTMVGRLTEAKNYPMLLRTAKNCKDKNLPIHFLIVGHGEKEVELKTLASELDVYETVHFLGLRQDISQLLAASDIFLFTTNFEGFPNALLEAMAAKLPLVTTNFLGVDELVQNHKNGIIVPVDDADAAAEALRFYVEHPDKAQEYGSNALNSVESVFSMNKLVEKTEALYQRLLSGCR